MGSRFWIFFSLVFSICADPPPNSPSITTASTNDQYIIIDCRDGLSNRLRLLAGYLYVLRESHSFSHIFMVWDINDACPGHFLQLFEPLSSVTFISSGDLPYLSARANAVYHASYMNYLEVLNRFGLHHPNDPPILWRQSRLEMYSLFILVPDLANLIQDYVARTGLCHHAAIHVRHTDLDELINASSSAISTNSGTFNHSTNDAAYEKFIESLPETMKIFLMTDNPSTQRAFLRRYGSQRILYYKTIPLHPDRVLPNHRRGLKQQSQSQKPQMRQNELFGRQLNPVRFTTLQHTLIDVMIAAHSSIFLGNPLSSLSDLVHVMNKTVVSVVPDPCYGSPQKEWKTKMR
jgi:hypothetical protein